jgi:hypothetical protein
MKLPMDAEGGDDNDLITEYFSILVEDAKHRHMLCDEFYFISDDALRVFKRFQSIREDLEFPGCRLEQAYLIWRQTPRATLHSLLSANGFELPDDFIQTGPISFFYSTDDDED